MKLNFAPSWRSKSIFVWSLFILGTSHVSAQLIGFGPSYHYDNGWNPSVAIAGSVAVEVHNGSGSAGPMWYHVGQVTSSGVQWGPSYQYDNGYNPQVALVGSTVVEVHNGGTAANLMWYHVGHVSGSKISWGPSYEYDTGNNPSIALVSCNTTANPNCGLFAVEMHNGSTSAGPMWYHVGRVSGFSITWGPSYHFDNGFNPSVGLQPCYTVSNVYCGITVVEVHNGAGVAGPMWIRAGNWTSGNTINFNNSIDYDWGWNPRISFTQYGELLEVHNGGGQPGPMWYHFGFWVGGNSFELGESYEYDWGWNPSAALALGSAVEVHNGSGSAGPMWFHNGVFTTIF